METTPTDSIATSSPPKSGRQRAPWGIIVIAVLLYLGAAIMIATSALPSSYLARLPKWVFYVGAFALAGLATGLFQKRRWAWYGTLSFVVVNGFYLYRGVFVLGQNQIVGLTILALMMGYLLLPSVRAVFLHPRQG
ncbi:MAG: hypothetical protein NVSMB42_11380 [Herpetosiphon sp.]